MASKIVIYEWCADVVAHQPEVRSAVRAEARRGGARARATLKAHRREGHSKIEVTYGTVDAFVSLDDTAGDQGAWMINLETGALDSAF